MTMTRNQLLHVGKGRLPDARTLYRAPAPVRSEDRLPIGTAMTLIAGASLALWLLIDLAVKTLI